MIRRAVLVLILALPIFSGCQKAYYAGMEKIGVHKREILVDRVEEARDSQEDAKEQFASALEEFNAVVGFEGGDLAAQYETLQRAYDRSVDRAEEVRTRIARVEDVAEALFDEWRAELDEYTDRQLRQSSASKLEQTRARYEQLITAMKQAEKKIHPVLDTFQDQVLFLKHNLNARAIASLKGELATMRTDISELVRSMENSIAEAETFIRQMEE
ncbi:MAG: DUF2959 domain-containing protein [Desulfovibrionales bacterium]